MAGLFDHIAGLILCDFSEIDEEPHWSLVDQLKRLVGDLPVPVGYGFSVGHGEQTGSLPIGVRARFEGDSGAVTLLESAVKTH
jgi:muramoyltetrapeptide carboxypeptidase